MYFDPFYIMCLMINYYSFLNLFYSKYILCVCVSFFTRFALFQLKNRLLCVSDITMHRVKSLRPFWILLVIVRNGVVSNILHSVNNNGQKRKSRNELPHIQTGGVHAIKIEAIVPTFDGK